jgi:endonuclease YncB( thermonuclease family)
MKAILLFFLFSTVSQINAQTEEVGKVVNVIDGNTVEVKSGNNPLQKLMLSGIDSPELTQEFGDKAKKYLEKMLLDKEVKFTITGKDRWGNYLAIMKRGDEDPRVALLEVGLAWTAEKNPIPELEAVRVKAAEKNKGLWVEENPLPPWTYRRQQTMMQAKSN